MVAVVLSVLCLARRLAGGVRRLRRLGHRLLGRRLLLQGRRLRLGLLVALAVAFCVALALLVSLSRCQTSRASQVRRLRCLGRRLLESLVSAESLVLVVSLVLVLGRCLSESLVLWLLVLVTNVGLVHVVAVVVVAPLLGPVAASVLSVSRGRVRLRGRPCEEVSSQTACNAHEHGCACSLVVLLRQACIEHMPSRPASCGRSEASLHTCRHQNSEKRERGPSKLNS